MAGTTVKVAASLLPSLDAVIRTESDSARPVTRPVDETVACVGALLVQVTGRSASSWPAASLTCAVSCSVWPITRPGAAAVTLTEATGGGGDWESLLHAATAPAPHVEAPAVGRCVCREAAGMVPPTSVQRGEPKPPAHGHGHQAGAVRAIAQLPVPALSPAVRRPARVDPAGIARVEPAGADGDERTASAHGDGDRAAGTRPVAEGTGPPAVRCPGGRETARTRRASA